MYLINLFYILTTDFFYSFRPFPYPKTLPPISLPLDSIHSSSEVQASYGYQQSMAYQFAVKA